MRDLLLRFATLPLALALIGLPASAQMRIVTYNTAEGAPAGLSTILPAIGEELRNGIAKPIDVLSLQEQTTPATTTQDIVNLLNAYYGAGTYARGVQIATSTGAGRPTIIYNTQTVQLISEDRASTASSTGGPRQTMRYQFRPIGYDASADFYVYSSHYKASNTADDADRRNVEATQVRANADALGQGASLIFTGDLNLYSSTEPAYQTLLSAGPGQAIDPLNPNNVTQNWDNSSSFASIHTQSPCSSATGNCGVGGGVDSRFDFQLSTAEVQDSEGFDLIAGSYHPFGNNGSTFNQSINSGSNTVTFPGVTSFTKSQILNALQVTTDHLPVVADYQLPAVLDALVGTIPTTLNVGQAFSLGVSVFNAAEVVAAIGADELDYTLTASGALSGLFNGIDAALGGGNLHNVAFDTSTPGLKSGQIVISTTSQSAANALMTIPVSYQVLAPALPGDYNGDGMVDAADYTVWRDGGAPDDGIGGYNLWVSNYGSSNSAVSVPEPTALLLGLIGVCLGVSRKSRG